MKELFDKFGTGLLSLPKAVRYFEEIEWRKHPDFEGVELKDIITEKDTDSKFSYHLVRIAPNMKIGCHIHTDHIETHEIIGGSGLCINEGTQIEYRTGVLSIIKCGIAHEVVAGANGLYIFAKFIRMK